jgi:hypothetical protein
VTPTLVGRWQTRLALLSTIGLAISAVFAVAFGSAVFYIVLVYVAVLGLAWDALYTALQSFRWERDWPPVFAVIFAVIEGLAIYLLATQIGVLGLPADLSLGLFCAHYGSVWVATYLFAQGPMRALFPWWRFHGGRIWPVVAAGQRGAGGRVAGEIARP